MTSLNLDHHALADVTVLVIDFEGFTLKGCPIEPVEVGAMRIVPPGVIDPVFAFDELIRPPPDRPMPPFFTADTGIRMADVMGKSPAETVLARLEDQLEGRPHVILAHNAHVEARILLRFAPACPAIAAMPFIDTLALARHLLPTLRSHKLDAVATYFGLNIPADRHRALADVRLTCEIFLQLLVLWRESRHDDRFYQLRRVAGIDVNPTPVQPSLFG